MILRQAIMGGPRTAYTTLLGTSSALILWGSLSAIGLSQIFARSHTAYNILKYTGVAYLVFLSLQTLWEARKEYGRFDYSGAAKTGIGQPREGAEQHQVEGQEQGDERQRLPPT